MRRDLSTDKHDETAAYRMNRVQAAEHLMQEALLRLDEVERRGASWRALEALETTYLQELQTYRYVATCAQGVDA